MNYINDFISDELIYALGWTVVHSLWQAIIIALLVMVLMLGLQKQSAKIRYIVYFAGLLSICFLSTLTFLDLYQMGTASNINNMITVGTTTGIEIYYSATNEVSIASIIVDFFNQHMPSIVCLWFLGMGFFAIRLIGGISFVQYLKTHQIYTVPSEYKRNLHTLMDKTPLDKVVQLAESSLIKVPMVLGYIKPIILLPLGTINQLHPKELDAILAHELAHIARNDYLLNVLQSVIEVLFYFNPVVWWLSANIRSERENCCDDIAVELCGNSLTYAKALVSLQEINQPPPMLVLSMMGKQSKLLHRIQRILKQPQNRNNMMEKLMATGLLLLTIGLLSMQAGASNLQETETTETIQIVSVDTNSPDEISVTVSISDTIPTSEHIEKHVIRYNTDKKDVSITRIDGELSELKIDGKKIPESEWEDYRHEINNIPPPPPPPGIAPPVPPVPPAPPKHKHKKKLKHKHKKTITTQDGEDGTTLIIIEQHNGEAPTHILINEGEAIVKVDGKKIPLNEAIVIEGDDVNFNGKIKFLETEESESLFPKGLFDDFEGSHFPTHFDMSGLAAIGNMEDFMLGFKSDNQEAMRELFEDRAETHQGFNNLWSEELQEEIERLFEEKQELFFQQQELAEAFREEALSMLEEHEADKEERFIELQENLLELQENAEDMRQDFFEEKHQKIDVNRIIGTELLEDGIIKDRAKFKFQLTYNELKVNGKKQPSSIHQKYLNLYENLTNSKIDSGSKIHIRHRSFGNTSFSFSNEI